MRIGAIIWLVGCIAWSIDALANLFHHNAQHSYVALFMAILFAIAYAFYRTQDRKSR